MSTRTSPFDVLIGVPFDCSGAFVGCERLPAAMRAAGIVDALGVDDVGNLQVAIADPVRDPASGVIGLQDVLAASRVIRDRLSSDLNAGRVPFVVGGDCTLLVGTAAALAGVRPDAGLLFVDGHLDCYDGRTSPTGEAADLELATILGFGPAALVEFADRTPAIVHRRVVALGNFDESEAIELGAPDPRKLAPEMEIVGLETLRADPAGHARDAADRLVDGGFWLHLDLDVLSKAALPAVDYAAEPGLDWNELLELLRPVFASPGLIGASLTILNPAYDPDGIYSARTVELLAEASRTPAAA